MQIRIRHQEIEDDNTKLGVQAVISNGEFTEADSANCAFVVDKDDISALISMLEISINNLIDYKLGGQHEERTPHYETGSTSGLEQALSS